MKFRVFLNNVLCSCEVEIYYFPDKCTRVSIVVSPIFADSPEDSLTRWTGFSYCSKGDQYVKRLGRRYAFVNLFKVHKLTRVQRKAIVDAMAEQGYNF